MPVLSEVIALGVPLFDRHASKHRSPPGRSILGAAIVNDVWGLQRDPDMAPRRRRTRRPGHHHAQSRRRRSGPSTSSTTSTTYFARSLDIACPGRFVARERIVLDPGIGFGKTPEQSMICIARLDNVALVSALPLLVGASRKRFITYDLRLRDRMNWLGGSLAAHLLAVENGAAIVRVHDVAPTVQALASRRQRSGARDERRGLRQWARAPRLSRRDAA